MGQKSHPTGLRVGIIYDWKGKWYTQQNYKELLQEDLDIREILREELGPQAAVSDIIIERLTSVAHPDITIHTARPGVIIGRKGEDIETLRAKLLRKLEKKRSRPYSTINLRIKEVRTPETNAKLVAESVAQQLEKRIMYRRAMKRAVTAALKAGALGVKICISGRLGGAEIARSEWYREGRVPLHTFRADIDYNTAIAKTTYGIIGVKVWIFKGEMLQQKNKRGDKS